MTTNPKLSPPNDPDDPDNYRPGDPEDSPVFAWILGGIVGIAAIVGLLIAQESPLTDLPWQTTQNMSAQPAPSPTQAN